MVKQHSFLFWRKRLLVAATAAALLFTAHCGTSRGITMTDDNVVRSDSKGLPPDVAKLWEKRHVEASLAQALPKLEELADKNPGDYNLQIIAARANYTYADGHLFLKLTEETEKQIKPLLTKHYDKAIQYSERAMSLQPDFKKKVKSGTSIEDALDLLGKDYIDSIYWRYAALARWSRLEGTATLLRNKGKFTKMMKRVEALEPNYFFGAVYRYYGGSETLSPTGSMAKGKEYFEKAIALENRFFGNHVLYADIWAAKKLDKDLFEKELNFVINNKPEILGRPEWVPEQIIEQEKAKKFLKEIDTRNFD
jgi:prepilin-type processing-associated H-X9-DG protein